VTSQDESFVLDISGYIRERGNSDLEVSMHKVVENMVIQFLVRGLPRHMGRQCYFMNTIQLLTGITILGTENLVISTRNQMYFPANSIPFMAVTLTALVAVPNRAPESIVLQ